MEPFKINDLESILHCRLLISTKFKMSLSGKEEISYNRFSKLHHRQKNWSKKKKKINFYNEIYLTSQNPLVNKSEWKWAQRYSCRHIFFFCSSKSVSHSCYLVFRNSKKGACISPYRIETLKHVPCISSRLSYAISYARCKIFFFIFA